MSLEPIYNKKTGKVVMRVITIKDISKKCGVSPATVSKALNGYGDISEATRELIQKTAQEMHYLPNAAARQLKTNTSHNIGIVYVDQTGSGLAHEYFSGVIDSAKEEAEKSHKSLHPYGRKVCFSQAKIIQIADKYKK